LPGSAAGPSILVLLASYDGAEWIGQQLESILAQSGVQVRVAVRDDASSDGTRQEIGRFATDVRVAPTFAARRSGSAAKNFLALIAESSAAGFDFVGFSDQDDIWSSDKLARACRALQQCGAVGYSAATTARWPDGRTAVLRQAASVTRSDFLFEGAGQGCTFVLRADFYARVREFLASHRDLMGDLHYHDWLIYALARSWGESWAFDSTSSTLYRQHAYNDTGARSSTAGIRKRLSLIRSGWYARQLASIATICNRAAPLNATVAEWCSIIGARRNCVRRLRMAIFCIRGGRRKMLDNLIVILAALADWL
jgi:rhamnosyltransferase